MLTGLSQNNYKIITAKYSRCSVWSKQELHEKNEVSFQTHKSKKRKKTDIFKTKQSLELMSMENTQPLSNTCWKTDAVFAICTLLWL